MESCVSVFPCCHAFFSAKAGALLQVHPSSGSATRPRTQTKKVHAVAPTAGGAVTYGTLAVAQALFTELRFLSQMRSPTAKRTFK